MKSCPTPDVNQLMTRDTSFGGPYRGRRRGVSVDDLQTYSGTVGPEGKGARPCFPESGQRPRQRGNQDGASLHAHNLSESNNRPTPRGVMRTSVGGKSPAELLARLAQIGLPAATLSTIIARVDLLRALQTAITKIEHVIAARTTQAADDLLRRASSSMWWLVQ